MVINDSVSIHDYVTGSTSPAIVDALKKVK
jgi:hypothetical protein